MLWCEADIIDNNFDFFDKISRQLNSSQAKSRPNSKVEVKKFVKVCLRVWRKSKRPWDLLTSKIQKTLQWIKLAPNLCKFAYNSLPVSGLSLKFEMGLDWVLIDQEIIIVRGRFQVWFNDQIKILIILIKPLTSFAHLH